MFHPHQVRQRWNRLCHVTRLQGKFFFSYRSIACYPCLIWVLTENWTEGFESGMWPRQVTESAVATTLALWTRDIIQWGWVLPRSGVYLLRFSVIQVMFVSEVLKYWAAGVVEAVSEINFLTYRPRWLVDERIPWLSIFFFFFTSQSNFFCVTNITINLNVEHILSGFGKVCLGTKCTAAKIIHVYIAHPTVVGTNMLYAPQ